MIIDTKALRELAQKATPGPWEVTNERFVRQSNDPRHVIARCSKADQLIQQNAEYIAAANPATVLALLDECETLREDLNDARNGWEQANVQLEEAIDIINMQRSTIDRLQQEYAADAAEIAKLNNMLDALREERTTLRAMLAYAAKEADGWHDEARGGSIENDARFDEIRKYLEALK